MRRPRLDLSHHDLQPLHGRGVPKRHQREDLLGDRQQPTPVAREHQLSAPQRQPIRRLHVWVLPVVPKDVPRELVAEHDQRQKAPRRLLPMSQPPLHRGLQQRLEPSRDLCVRLRLLLRALAREPLRMRRRTSMTTDNSQSSKRSQCIPFQATLHLSCPSTQLPHLCVVVRAEVAVEPEAQHLLHIITFSIACFSHTRSTPVALHQT